MKTIKQIADEIGVSKQAVFYRIKKPPLSNSLTPLTSKENGVLMVSFDGEKLIKQAFNVDADKETVKQFDGSFDGSLTVLLQETISVLESQLAAKDEQLAAKDRQIEELTATIRIQAESIQADRKNELAGTLIDGQRMLGTASVKKRRWQFWKNND